MPPLVFNPSGILPVLGKRRSNKTRKCKALPENYPDQGPAKLDEAYGDLTRAAFATWIRLMVEPRENETLKKGRGKVARMLGYSQRRSNEVLLELSRKGYVSFIFNGSGKPTEVVIERRAMISSRGNFVRLV